MGLDALVMLDRFILQRQNLKLRGVSERDGFKIHLLEKKKFFSPSFVIMTLLSLT